jgi:hypothetical protein
MTKRVAFCVVILCIVFAGRLAGQSGDALGRISGHVGDTVGAVIPRASVFVHPYANADEVNLTTHTDIHGDFVLALPAGAYDILITSAGFESKLQIVVVQPGKTSKLQWKLIAHPCDFPGVNCDSFQVR